jgi:putative addiction module killer protein
MADIFERFLETLQEDEVRKIDYVISLLENSERLSLKFIRLIRDGLYELRIMWGNNTYRVFFIFDKDKIVVLFNGFQKKSQKTPAKEITKALKIRDSYYADKQS